MVTTDIPGVHVIRTVLVIVVAALTATSCSSTDPKTADQVMADITAQVPTAKMGVVYTPDNDPNHLLGRPNGYTSKVSFTDSRVDPKLLQGQRPDALDAGGSIEVYPDAEGAQLRQQYIQGLQKAAPIFGTEYSYLDGPVLVRVSGKLNPTQAAEYEVGQTRGNYLITAPGELPDRSHSSQVSSQRGVSVALQS